MTLAASWLCLICIGGLEHAPPSARRMQTRSSPMSRHGRAMRSGLVAAFLLIQGYGCLAQTAPTTGENLLFQQLAVAPDQHNLAPALSGQINHAVLATETPRRQSSVNAENASVQQRTAAPASVAPAVGEFMRVAAMRHPRLFGGQADHSQIIAATKSDRAVGIKALSDYLRRHSFQGTAKAVTLGPYNPADPAALASWWPVERALQGLAESAFAWFSSGDPWQLQEVRARASHFAPAIQSSSCAGNITQARTYMWYFALAYDFVANDLTATERAQFLSVIELCAGALKGVPAAVHTSPPDGTAFNALGKLVGAGLIVLRDLPSAQSWLVPAAQLYLDKLSPWGGADGGYANGTSYAMWDSGDIFLTMDLLQRVLGLQTSTHPWASNFHRYVAYTLPPGAPAGLFGDGAEVKRTEAWSRFGKAVMSRSTTALAGWYAANVTGDDPARLEGLLSPLLRRSNAFPPNEPNSVFFPSIGWAALHSDLSDTKRASVYFKSSPYGSFNHSHGDQNNFVVHKAGQIILSNSGVYDYYGSPHWLRWYKTTAAHNAVTFDDGQGQDLGKDGYGSATSNGKITNFLTGKGWALATGDATQSYAGKLSNAMRTVALLDERFVVVMDTLVAQTPRRLELNFHTLAEPEPSDGGIVIARSACLKTFSTAALLTTTSLVVAPPSQGVAWTPNWVTRYAASQAQLSMGAVTVIDLKCSSKSSLKPTAADGAWTLNTGRHRLVFTESTHIVVITTLF